MAYGVESFDSFEGKWKKKSPYSVTKHSFSSKIEAEKEMIAYQNRLMKINKKAESDLRRNSYGGVQMPKLRVRKR